MNQRLEQDLAAIERRENHLWLTTLALLLIFVGAMAMVFFFAVIEGSAWGVERRTLITSLISLFGLCVLFCAWVVISRRSFSRIRRMFEAQAMRDALTGLFNRQSFEERIRQEMKRVDRAGALLGVMICDLDDFKRVNDTYGHPVGDEVLKRLAKAALSATRGTDLVFRWGGDEILVLLSPTVREGALAAAQRIRAEIATVQDDLGFSLDVSAGISLYPEHATEVDELVRLADSALYIAKKGGDKTHVGEEELPLDDLAVNLVFQPVVDSQTRQVLGHEVLSRNPGGGAGIGDLFRRYEAVGQLDELKRMIFKRQIREAERLELDRVFVNVDFPLLESVEPFDPPTRTEIVFDISEAEAGTAIEGYFPVIEAWRKRGFKFAIDDFGSGFMSLPFVARLFPSFIKMDRSAILEARGSERYSSFLRDMLAAMRNYSEEGIIAEGVETDEELDIVRRLGVDQVQGHLIGRPVEMPEPVGQDPATEEPGEIVVSAPDGPEKSEPPPGEPT